MWYNSLPTRVYFGQPVSVTLSSSVTIKSDDSYRQQLENVPSHDRTFPLNVLARVKLLLTRTRPNPQTRVSVKVTAMDCTCTSITRMLKWLLCLELPVF